MSDIRFEKGSAYIGTSTIDNRRQKVFQVVARRGNLVSFAHVRNVRSELTDDCDGTEIVRIKDADGFDYFLSAQVDVNVGQAFSVVKMCQA